MITPPTPTAAMVLRCRDLDACLAFFTDLGCRLETIFPADAPRIAELSGFGLRLRLEGGPADGGGHLRLPGAVSQDLVAPNGARVEVVAGRAAPDFPPASFAVSPRANQDTWHAGRAGMLYRDLIPGRQHGAVIASHIRIPKGGPVPDYVHYHRIAAQVIYCHAGWVRLVYEDQGEPFVMQAGDCVLQPPEIRHRVLACGDGLEVVEVGAPAEHETCVDHDLRLPNRELVPHREFAGQRFVWHRPQATEWRPWRWPGWSACDTGIGAASRAAIAVRTVRAPAAAPAVHLDNDATPCFWFVRRGALDVTVADQSHHLDSGDACLLPPLAAIGLQVVGPDLELLEVAVAAYPTQGVLSPTASPR